MPYEVQTVHGPIRLTSEARRALVGADQAGLPIMQLLSELGVIAIGHTEEAVPTDRAFFDSNGCGPYDSANL